jgi:hypothetical protein
VKRLLATLYVALLAGCNAPSISVPFAPATPNGVAVAIDYQVLYSMNGKAGGGVLWGGIAVDAAGNIFGASMKGGPPCTLPGDKYGCGVAFELVRSGSNYRERVLHDFGGPSDGIYPEAAPTLGAGGAIFGTTSVGGSEDCRSCGTAYELTLQAGKYGERVIHYFGKELGSDLRYSSLVAGKDGALYGVAPIGGPSHCACGTVFKLEPAGTHYRGVLLHAFGGIDGSEPLGPLLVGNGGKIYGATYVGGGSTCNISGNGCGVVFSIERTANGYKERILHVFGGGTDGADPDGQLIADSAGTIYGTTEDGGGPGCMGDGCGIVYSLTPSRAGYRETVLHRFQGGTGGSYARGGLVFGPNGMLFGTTGGGPQGGTIFEMVPSKHRYRTSIVHTFSGPNDGYAPESGLTVAPDGTIYGTTLLGGKYGVGTVFKFTP